MRTVQKIVYLLSLRLYTISSKWFTYHTFPFKLKVAGTIKHTIKNKQSFWILKQTDFQSNFAFWKLCLSIHELSECINACFMFICRGKLSSFFALFLKFLIFAIHVLLPFNNDTQNVCSDEHHQLYKNHHH